MRAGASRKKRRAKRDTALPESNEGGEQRGGGPLVAEPKLGAGAPKRVAAPTAAAEGRAKPDRASGRAKSPARAKRKPHQQS